MIVQQESSSSIDRNSRSNSADKSPARPCFSMSLYENVRSMLLEHRHCIVHESGLVDTSLGHAKPFEWPGAVIQIEAQPELCVLLEDDGPATSH